MDEGQTPENQDETKPAKGEEKGTINLAIGGGFAAYGTTIALTMGAVCPICAVATPLFLGLGGVQRYKYLKSKADKDEEG